MYRKECSEETLIIKIGPVSSFFGIVEYYFLVEYLMRPSLTQPPAAPSSVEFETSALKHLLSPMKTVLVKELYHYYASHERHF